MAIFLRRVPVKTSLAFTMWGPWERGCFVGAPEESKGYPFELSCVRISHIEKEFLCIITIAQFFCLFCSTVQQPKNSWWWALILMSRHTETFVLMSAVFCLGLSSWNPRTSRTNFRIVCHRKTFLNAIFRHVNIARGLTTVSIISQSNIYRS